MLKFLFSVCVSLFLVSNTALAAVTLKSCGGNQKITIIKVELEGCTSAPCTVVSGRSYSLDVYFRTSKHTTSLNYFVRGIWKHNGLRDVSVAFKFGNFCNYLIGSISRKKCPVKSGERYHARHRFQIPYLMTVKMKLEVETKILDYQGEVISCTRLDVIALPPTRA